MTPDTSAGFEAIQFADEVLGVGLFPWQKWLLVHALELDEAGGFRFRTVLLLVARQNGKTTLIQVLALWRMYVDGAALTIGTAQNLDVAEEAWTATVELAEGVPELAAEIAAVDRTNGKKALRLTTGQRYKVAAASRRGGRGLSGDLIFLDELREHQKWDAWGAVTKTTMARARAQIWGPSNAGDASSVVLWDLRGKALADLNAGRAGSLGIFEWSAPDGCRLDDQMAWAAANPSLGYSIQAGAIQAALDTDPEAVFRTEVLCQWVDRLRPRVVGALDWLARVDAGSQIDDAASKLPVFSIEVSLDRSMTAISVCGQRSDGLPHIEVVEHRPGVDWAPARLAELASVWQAEVVMDTVGPVAGLLPLIQLAGVQPRLMSSRDVAAAFGLFVDLATRDEADGVVPGLRHLGQEQLDEALAGGVARDIGDGGTAWGRKSSGIDISPLVSATNALWGWHTSEFGTVQVFNFADLDADDPDADVDDDEQAPDIPYWLEAR